MNDELYHECCLRVAQAGSLLDDLRNWGYETITADPPEPQVIADFVETVQFSPSVVTDNYNDLLSQLQRCTRCRLNEQRQTVVVGRGNPQADLVLVGEAPGQQEDVQGLPFVGEAGQLLDKILFAMGLAADDVYICNLIKCRPPGNRDPQPDEVAACEPYLRKQLDLIRPRLIVTLGRFSAQALLDTKDPLKRIRGQWHSYNEIPLLPTFHPAYLLRSPTDKKLLWEDMKLVMARLRSA